MRGAGPAAQHRGQSRMQRILDLLRADEMDMGVHSPRGQDTPLARDDLRARTDDDVDAGLGIGVAGLADLQDAPVAQSHVGLPDAGMIEDQRIGDHRVRGPARPADLALAHTVADHLAAPEFHLFAIDRHVGLDLDDQVGIAQPHPVAGGGAVHVGIGGAGDRCGHGRAPGPRRELT